MNTDIIKVLPEETIKELYTDLAQPTVREIGKLVSKVPAAINAALTPLDQWMLQKQYNFKETEKLLELKLANINPEKIVPPEAYVAVPALQALSYSINNETLREMYTNLLAQSMNVDTKDYVHPSFVSIIEQLSPFDAMLLSEINKYNSYNIPIIKIFLTNRPDNGTKDLLKHVISPQFNINAANTTQSIISLENFMRLNLIEITYSTYLGNEQLYNPLLHNDLVKEFIQKYNNEHKYVDTKLGIMQVTSFAKAFFKTCL